MALWHSVAFCSALWCSGLLNGNVSSINFMAGSEPAQKSLVLFMPLWIQQHHVPVSLHDQLELFLIAALKKKDTSPPDSVHQHGGLCIHLVWMMLEQLVPVCLSDVCLIAVAWHAKDPIVVLDLAALERSLGTVELPQSASALPSALSNLACSSAAWKSTIMSSYCSLCSWMHAHVHSALKELG